MIRLELYYRPPTKLREGNVFTCLSVHGGGGGSVSLGGGW